MKLLLFAVWFASCLLAINAVRNPAYKSWGGPATPRPQARARYTSHWAMKVLENQNGNPGTATFHAEAGRAIKLLTLLQNEDDVVEVRTPGAAAFRDSRDLGAGNETVVNRGLTDIHGTSVNAVRMRFTQPPPRGTFQVRARKSNRNGAKSGKRVAIASYLSPFHLQCSFGRDGGAIVNENLDLQCSFFDVERGSDAPLENIWSSGSVTFTHQQSGVSQTLSFFTEGTSNSLSFVPSAAGQYSVEVNALGRAPDGSTIERSHRFVFEAIGRSFSGVTGASLSFATAPNGLREVSLRLSLSDVAVSSGGFMVNGELYGVDSAGAEAFITVFGGKSDLDGSSLELFIQEDHFYSGVHAPFTLRNVRINCPETHAFLATVDSLVASADFYDIPDPTTTGLQPRMSQNPEHRGTVRAGDFNVQYRLAEESEDRQQRLIMGLNPNKRQHELQANGHYHVLVHGYCSNLMWPSNQFTDPFVFSDTNANRNNDQFAQLIFSQTNSSGVSACGIMAHSQGGLASVTLYARYWSCLDNANMGGTKRIQSVGSPYQGTNLAGVLAQIGGWFGVQCGSQYDLTYSGAAAWISMLPGYAPAATSYYTTGYLETNCWYCDDYCNYWTDLVLSGINDGVVEKTYAQFSPWGAINMGHTQSECHTNSMRYGAQYLDASRNAIMNAASKW